MKKELTKEQIRGILKSILRIGKGEYFAIVQTQNVLYNLFGLKVDRKEIESLLGE